MRNRVCWPANECRQFGRINKTQNSLNDWVFLDVWIVIAWSVAIEHPLACLMTTLNLYKTVAWWCAEVRGLVYAMKLGSYLKICQNEQLHIRTEASPPVHAILAFCNLM